VSGGDVKGSQIYVGDTVEADFEDVGPSHRMRYVGPAVVTAVHPSPRVRPHGWAYDRHVRWSEIRKLE
jgi:hypothetical protein